MGRVHCHVVSPHFSFLPQKALLAATLPRIRRALLLFLSTQKDFKIKGTLIPDIFLELLPTCLCERETRVSLLACLCILQLPPQPPICFFGHSFGIPVSWRTDTSACLHQPDVNNVGSTVNKIKPTPTEVSFFLGLSFFSQPGGPHARYYYYFFECPRRTGPNTTHTTTRCIDLSSREGGFWSKIGMSA